MKVLCPFCEIGDLQATTRVEDVIHNGTSLQVSGFRVSTCNHCDEEMVRSEDAKVNQKLIADACLEADGKLQTGDLKCIRMRHGLSQAEAAAVFGGGANAFSKYERGEVMQSKSMDLLLRSYDRFPEVRAYLKQRAGMATEVWTSMAATPARAVRRNLHPTPIPSAANDTTWADVEIEAMHAVR